MNKAVARGIVATFAAVVAVGLLYLAVETRGAILVPFLALGLIYLLVWAFESL